MILEVQSSFYGFMSYLYLLKKNFKSKTNTQILVQEYSSNSVVVFYWGTRWLFWKKSSGKLSFVKYYLWCYKVGSKHSFPRWEEYYSIKNYAFDIIWVQRKCKQLSSYLEYMKHQQGIRCMWCRGSSHNASLLWNNPNAHDPFIHCNENKKGYLSIMKIRTLQWEYLQLTSFCTVYA